jgi:hypothetical protein
MQYMLLIYEAPGSWPEDEQDAMMREYFAYTEELKEAGALVAGDALYGTDTARSVQVRDGDTLVTDGPFAETREQLGGYYLLECRDLDDAISWAARIPDATHGTVEVRPVMDYEAMGYTHISDVGESSP